MTYRISNCEYSTLVHRSGVEMFNQVEAALSVIRPEVVCSLLRSNTVSMRAVWDNFVTNVCPTGGASWIGNRREMFCSQGPIGHENIIRVAWAFHPEWFDDEKIVLLPVCARLGSMDMVSTLLERGALCPMNAPSAILQATFAGAFGCVGLLIRALDLNAVQHYTWDGFHTTAYTSVFAEILGLLFHLRTKVSRSGAKHDPNRNARYLRLLDMLIEHGANVDSPYPLDMHGLQGFEPHHRLLELSDGCISCLDTAFYLDKEVFHIMRRCTAVDQLLLSRSGVFTAAAMGHLGVYLSSRVVDCAEEQDSFLRAVLIEQFFINGHCSWGFGSNRQALAAALDAEHAKVVRALLEFDVPLDDELIPIALDIWLTSIRKYAFCEDMSAILVKLNKNAIPVKATTFEHCIEGEGTELLDLLLSYGAFSQEDVALQGASALVRAAMYGNHEAVSWMLTMGVDVNAEVVVHDRTQQSITMIAKCFHAEVSPAIRQQLLHAGALLKMRSVDQTPSLLPQALCSSLFRPGDPPDVLALWGMFQQYPSVIAKVTPRRWRQALSRMITDQSYQRDAVKSEALDRFFDRLLQMCAESDGQSPLTLAILGRRRAVVEALLLSSADVSESLRDYRVLVRIDRTEGSHFGRAGYWRDTYCTPLMAAIWTRDLGLARRLLERGADVNTLEGHRRSWYTNALGVACGWAPISHCKGLSKLEVVKFLLNNGADVASDGSSSSPVRPWIRTPLLYCIEIGDLATAAYLLQQGADPSFVFIRTRHLYEDNAVQYYACTALDDAIYERRLDQAQLLLKAGGLSGEPGTTGYDGAIRQARAKRLFAHVRLIQQHICASTELFHSNSNVWRIHQARIEQVKQSGAEIIQRARATELDPSGHHTSSETDRAHPLIEWLTDFMATSSSDSMG